MLNRHNVERADRDTGRPSVMDFHGQPFRHPYAGSCLERWPHHDEDVRPETKPVYEREREASRAEHDPDTKVGRGWAFRREDVDD